ncbi:aldo/keto reductase [Saccharothrix sp.]|uniref:aldo/keto reductase n=1 Tax=Saccharothrix sp. TaxID=1873460 RepID=UPI0035C87522
MGIGLVPFPPLGRGFPTGRYKSTEAFTDNDVRRSQPRFAAANPEHNLSVVSLLEDMASDKRVTAGQLALAWVQHRGEDVVPIAGPAVSATSTAEHEIVVPRRYRPRHDHR